MDKISKIEIDFDKPIDFPEGFEQALSSLIEMLCEKYKKENVTRTMWLGSYGAKPINGELMFDDTIYHIHAMEAEDKTGHNKFNPNSMKLKNVNAKLRSKGWNNANVSTPKFTDEVLVVRFDVRSVEKGHFVGGKWWNANLDKVIDVQYWTEIPKIPESEEANLDLIKRKEEYLESLRKLRKNLDE